MEAGQVVQGLQFVCCRVLVLIRRTGRRTGRRRRGGRAVEADMVMSDRGMQSRGRNGWHVAGDAIVSRERLLTRDIVGGAGCRRVRFVAIQVLLPLVQMEVFLLPLVILVDLVVHLSQSQ